MSDGGETKCQRTQRHWISGFWRFWRWNFVDERIPRFLAHFRPSWEFLILVMRVEPHWNNGITFRILRSLLKIAGTAAVTVWEPYLHLFIQSFTLILLQVLRSICWFALRDTLRFFASMLWRTTETSSLANLLVVLYNCTSNILGMFSWLKLNSPSDSLTVQVI